MGLPSGTVVPPEDTSTTLRPAAACCAIKSRARAVCSSSPLGAGLDSKYSCSAMAAASVAWAEDMLLGTDDALEKIDDVGDEGLDVKCGKLNARLSAGAVDQGSRVWDGEDDGDGLLWADIVIY